MAGEGQELMRVCVWRGLVSGRLSWQSVCSHVLSVQVRWYRGDAHAHGVEAGRVSGREASEMAHGGHAGAGLIGR